MSEYRIRPIECLQTLLMEQEMLELDITMQNHLTFVEQMLNF